MSACNIVRVTSKMGLVTVLVAHHIFVMHSVVTVLWQNVLLSLYCLLYSQVIWCQICSSKPYNLV